MGCSPGAAEARFWPKVDKDGPVPAYRPDLGPCWLWTAATDRDGYGRFSVHSRRLVYAHRFAYESLVGPIADGLTIDHLCRVPPCVNTDHLEPVTRGVNVLRGISPSALAAKKTHCLRGHPFDAENTALRRGQRCCRTCKRAQRRAYSARKRAAGKLGLPASVT